MVLVFYKYYVKWFIASIYCEEGLRRYSKSLKLILAISGRVFMAA